MSKRCGVPQQDVNGTKMKKSLVKDADAASSSEANTANMKFTFKNPNFQPSGAVKSGRKKSWKNLKPIAMSERSQAPLDAPVYLNIESPPLLKPAKKYSDISGQVSKYTDPETGLYFASAEEYKQIKRLTSDIVQGYLDIRSVMP